jgi:hypothetical protein
MWEATVMLQHALKEWAVICEALGRGEQSLLLCKGGHDERDSEFIANQARFWLYPTFSHQQKDGIIEDAQPLLQHVEANRPPAGKVRVQFWAEVTTIYRIREELPVLLLAHLHCWSEESVRQLYHHDAPGLYLLVVRVYRAPTAHEIVELPEYESNRWAELEKPLPTEASTPVLDDERFRIVRKQLDLLLSPTAYA